jgi:hypothetical protein
MFFSKAGLVLAGLYLLFAAFMTWYIFTSRKDFAALVALIVPVPWPWFYSLFLPLKDGLTRSLYWRGIILNLICLYFIGFLIEKLFS